MSFESRDLGAGARALVESSLEERGFLAAFSERSGGKSGGPFAGMNLSYSVGDDPANVAANRARLIRGLGVAPFAVPGQVHGARLVRVGRKRAGSGFDGPEGVVSGSDGLCTSSPGLTLAVVTADCVPIVLASPVEGLVAAIHAGWRGIAAGIVSRAITLFGRPADVRAAIGPAIGPCHYEVGEDVALAVASAQASGAMTQRRGGRLFLDLAGTVRAGLREGGVRRVEDAGLCTACDGRRFFSHRRDGASTGRQAGLAVRLPP